MVLDEVQDTVKAIEKKSIWKGEIVQKKLPYCGIFRGYLITFTTWWDFQLKGVGIHILRNPKTSQDTWRKGGLCSERPEGERMFFLRKTRRNHLGYLEVSEDFVWEPKETLRPLEGKSGFFFFSFYDLKERPIEASWRKPILSWLILIERCRVLFTLWRCYNKRACKLSGSNPNSDLISLLDLQ